MRNIQQFSLASALLATTIASVGCASYQVETLNRGAGPMDGGRPVVVQVPEDGAYGDDDAKGSGLMTARAVRQALARHAKDVSIGEAGKVPPADAYLVVPEILQWEERATEWSGLPDRIQVKVQVKDQAGAEVSGFMWTAKSSWFTFGGDHPQDLLVSPAKNWARRIYSTAPGASEPHASDAAKPRPIGSPRR